MNKIIKSSKLVNKSNPNLLVNQNTEDQDNPLLEQKYLGYFEKQQTLSHVSLWIDEEVKPSSYYRQVLNRIDNMNEGDYLEINLNTYGGDLQGCMSLVHAIRSTAADVHCNIIGVAASAGSIIALSCPSIAVADHATLMAHSAFGGSVGTLGNLVHHTNFMEKHTKAIMQEVYKDFLDEKELEQLFLGREFWFDADEISERIQRKFNKQQEESDEQDYTECMFCADNKECNGGCTEVCEVDPDYNEVVSSFEEAQEAQEKAPKKKSSKK